MFLVDLQGKAAQIRGAFQIQLSFISPLTLAIPGVPFPILAVSRSAGGTFKILGTIVASFSKLM
jgi:hypothetical protein